MCPSVCCSQQEGLGRGLPPPAKQPPPPPSLSNALRRRITPGAYPRPLPRFCKRSALRGVDQCPRRPKKIKDQWNLYWLVCITLKSLSANRHRNPPRRWNQHPIRFRVFPTSLTGEWAYRRHGQACRALSPARAFLEAAGTSVPGVLYSPAPQPFSSPASSPRTIDPPYTHKRSTWGDFFSLQPL